MGVVWTFLLSSILSPLSPSLWETARYRLKYCLKGPLNPKPTNQPTNQKCFIFFCVVLKCLYFLNMLLSTKLPDLKKLSFFLYGFLCTLCWTYSSKNNLHVLKFVTSGLICYKSWHGECVYIVPKSYAERYWPR